MTLLVLGENLRDHYGTRLTARAKNVRTINELARGARLLGEIAKYFWPALNLELGPTLVYCFWHSDETVHNSDLPGISFTPASYKEGMQAWLDDEPGFTLAS